MMLKTRKTVINRDVIFDETKDVTNGSRIQARGI